MTPKLKWTKSNNKLSTKHEGLTYEIFPVSRDNSGPHPTHKLTRCGKEIYRSFRQDGKDVCKRVANLIVSDEKPIYKKVLKTITDEEQKESFLMDVAIKGLKHIPQIKGPKRKSFAMMAEDKTPFGMASLSLEIRNRYNLEESDLIPEYLDSLYVELWPVYNKLPPQEEMPPPKELEVYKGPPPAQRQQWKKVLYVVSKSDKCPYFPVNAKYRTLRKWGERIRDYFDERKTRATVQYLKHAIVFHPNWNVDRKTKAQKRLGLIYKEEHRNERRILNAMFKKPREEVRPPCPKKKVPTPLQPFLTKNSNTKSKATAPSPTKKKKKDLKAGKRKSRNVQTVKEKVKKNRK